MKIKRVSIIIPKTMSYEMIQLMFLQSLYSCHHLKSSFLCIFFSLHYWWENVWDGNKFLYQWCYRWTLSCIYSSLPWLKQLNHLLHSRQRITISPNTTTLVVKHWLSNDYPAGQLLTVKICHHLVTCYYRHRQCQ